MTLRYDNLNSITSGITIEQKMVVGIGLSIIATRCYLGRGWKITQSQELFWMAKMDSKIDEWLPIP